MIKKIQQMCLVEFFLHLYSLENRNFEDYFVGIYQTLKSFHLLTHLFPKT